MLKTFIKDKQRDVCHVYCEDWSEENKMMGQKHTKNLYTSGDFPAPDLPRKKCQKEKGPSEANLV